jgi:hypothetical protein
MLHGDIATAVAKWAIKNPNSMREEPDIDNNEFGSYCDHAGDTAARRQAYEQNLSMPHVCCPLTNASTLLCFQSYSMPTHLAFCAIGYGPIVRPTHFT